MMNRYNVIIVVIDSLRQDHVSFYSRGEEIFPRVPPPRTPNIDKFAKESIVFINAYPSGLPTIPQRTELMTGHFTLPYRPWAPLTTWDRTLAEILKHRGYVTGLITDTYHLFKPGYNFHAFMDTFIWIRGQEYDAYRLPPPTRRNVEDFINDAMKKRNWDKLVEKFLANIDDFEREEDWFAAKVFRKAAEWIKINKRYDGCIFLWVDCFDPHEPWYPPPQYLEKYGLSNRKPLLILPMGGYAKEWASEEDIDVIRTLYMAEVEYVDRWFGYFYETLRDIGLLDNSIIILLADHGHPLADHGKFLKGTDRLYNELLKIPFMVRLPGGEKARVVDALIMMPDVAPTILELLGFEEDAKVLSGRSFLDVLNRNTDRHRSYIVAGYHEGIDRCVRDERYSLILRPEGEPDELYDLWKDPRETHNIIDEKPEEAKRLARYAMGIFSNTRLGIARRMMTYIKGLQGKYELYIS